VRASADESAHDLDVLERDSEVERAHTDGVAVLDIDELGH
jgi:hypothetical protein